MTEIEIDPSLIQDTEDSIGLQEMYPIVPPYAFVAIEFDFNTRKLFYRVIEPTLDEEQGILLKKIKEEIIERLDIPRSHLKQKKLLKSYLEKQVNKVIKDVNTEIIEEKVSEKLIYYLLRDFTGYGKIDVLFQDENIEDISCNGLGVPVYIWHKKYESIPTNIIYKTEDELEAILNRLAYRAGAQISVARPILEGTLPEDFRIQLTREEVSKRGNSFTIRKLKNNPYTLIDLINFGTLSPKIAAYLWILMENTRSIMVCGSTASGKTTMLNSICKFIRPDMKVVTIEEVRELQLHDNWVPLVPRPSYQQGVQEITLFDLLKSALRQRPDYIIVGEVRGEEAYTLFQSIATGHGGICSIHADSIEYALKRLRTRPMNIPDIMIPLMNVAIQIRRMKKNNKIIRRIDTVTEILRIDESNNIITKNRFIWDPENDKYKYIKTKNQDNIFNDISNIKHISLDVLNEELKKREVIIKWMIKNDIRDNISVNEIIWKYYDQPEETYQIARFGEVI